MGKKNIEVAKRLEKFEYAIRDVVAVAKELERNGKKITYLSIGDTAKYFETPKHIKKAFNDAVNDNYNYYVDSLGNKDLRRAIAEIHKKDYNLNISPDDILITSGVSEAINFTYAGLLENNDEILIPGPSYPPFCSYALLFGGVPVEYKMDEENKWQPDIDDLGKKITDKTRGIVVISPNNPVGVVYTEKMLKEIINIAGEYNIPIISDGIYEKFVYDGSYISPAALSKDVPVITFKGFSKTYKMTGLRLGCIFYHDPTNVLTDFKESMKKLARIRLCANAPAQKAAIAALEGPQDHIKHTLDELRNHRDFCLERLNEIEGIECERPEGAFYLFPKIDLGDRWKNDKEFVIDFLNKKQVLFVYGSGFGKKYGSSHMRIVYLAPLPTLQDAMDKLADFMKEKK
ncbi:MAG: aminotransferase class I/II-fold pyridoxal phosphate-dependent enzyme [Candidatus Helarchaeota archaeon]